MLSQVKIIEQVSRIQFNMMTWHRLLMDPQLIVVVFQIKLRGETIILKFLPLNIHNTSKARLSSNLDRIEIAAQIMQLQLVEMKATIHAKNLK